MYQYNTLSMLTLLLFKKLPPFKKFVIFESRDMGGVKMAEE